MSGCFSRGPHWGPSLQPRHVPWWGMEHATLCSQAGTQSTEPYQPGPNASIFPKEKAGLQAITAKVGVFSFWVKNRCNIQLHRLVKARDNGQPQWRGIEGRECLGVKGQEYIGRTGHIPSGVHSSILPELDPAYPLTSKLKCGPKTSSSSSTWELVRNATSQAPLQACWTNTQEARPSKGS